ncbi:MAG TPA: DUF6345 domain-containing protein [Candidatus Acidoferrales bacterium]|nr:DUF6345 domain-containing protein [Candidatus Acidoferrales bacterium]
MFFRRLFRRPSAARLAALLLSLCLCAQLPPAAAQTAAIQFTVPVPAAPPEMQTYRLAATQPPVAFLNEKLAAIRLPALQLETKTYIARAAGPLTADHVRAFADPVTGDAHFIPSIADLVRPSILALHLPVERAQSLARTALTDVRFIPKDVTELRVAPAITVMGGATAHTSGAALAVTPARTAPSVVLTIVPAVRYASGLPVYGLGSHAVISLANDGSIVGALRRWRTASLGARLATSITADQVRAAISRQLRSQLATPGTQAVVDSITLAYYDGNANYLQPVYRFEATVRPADEKVSSIRVAGYVPLGKELEPIPDLAAPPSGVLPKSPQRVAQNLLPPAVQNMHAVPDAGGPPAITLGEYANQDWPNNGAYVDMANAFLSGLTWSLFRPTPPITRTQWFVAYPWEVVGPASRDYLNAVNVAYTEPHGNWLYNTTLSNNAQPWYVPNIGTGGNPGFGAAAGGVLATWVIMSCEVIPSMYDRQNEAGASDNPYTAFNAWWPVFQGLHNVIGFRTEMLYPDDNLQFGFGYDVSLGGDVNAAWFQEVAANDGNDGTYNDGHLIGNPSVHYDRASTMIDARDLGQSIYSVGAQSPSTTLWNFWMNN